MNKKRLWIGIGVVVLFLVFVFGTCAGQYNRLVTADEQIQTDWSQIENVLQRRNDLIPNLVNTVKGYAAHEKEIFEEVARARSRIGAATTLPEKIAAQEEMGAAIARLLLIVERYPDLKANQNFLALQDELAGTENRIAVERRRFNETVRNYNVLTRRFPTNVVARVMGYGKKDVYFEAKEQAKDVPTVTF